jgi:hypothetical protein
MKTMPVRPVPGTVTTNPVPPVAPAARTRSVPPPQPKADTGGKHAVATGRGVVPQKPHNPDNHLSAMPTAAPNGGAVKGYSNGGMVKGYRNGGMVKGGKC